MENTVTTAGDHLALAAATKEIDKLRKELEAANEWQFSVMEALTDGNCLDTDVIPKIKQLRAAVADCAKLVHYIQRSPTGHLGDHPVYVGQHHNLTWINELSNRIDALEGE